jgi:uncharacterized membrane protein
MIQIETLLQSRTNRIIIAVLVIGAIICWHVFSSRSNVSNDGITDNTVRQELGTAINQQSESINTIKTVETGLSNSIKSVGTIESTVNNATTTNSNNITTATDSTSLIADCQRILSEVRAGGKR